MTEAKMVHILRWNQRALPPLGAIIGYRNGGWEESQYPLELARTKYEHVARYIGYELGAIIE